MIPVYVVHLPNPERKAKIAAELARVGFDNVTYIYAREPYAGYQSSNMRRNPRGEFGCTLSHLKAIATAIADNVLSALFVEDDVQFADGFRADSFNPPLILPPDWNIVYLGGHPRAPVQPIGHGLVRIGAWSCAESYYMHKAAMRRFLQFWCDRAGQPNAMFDFILGEFAAQGGGYAYYPQLTHQPVGWSHIGQKIDDKSACIEKGWRTNLA